MVTSGNDLSTKGLAATLVSQWPQAFDIEIPDEEAESMTGWIGLMGFYTCTYGLRQLAWHRGEASARGCRAAKVSLMASLTAGSP